MKRYLFSILFALFAIGGVGACYIYGAIEHLPKYKLTTIQGDPEEGDAIQLSGSYYGRVYSEALNVTAEGSHYVNEQNNFRRSILNYRAWMMNIPEFQQLVDEQRQFMRGKRNVNGFYNDEEWLIYVDASFHHNHNSDANGSLSISTLHKSSKQTNEYEVSINADISGLNLADVQLIDDRIHILTWLLYPANSYSSSVYDYVVDLNTGQLLSNERLIMQDTNIENYVFRIRAITGETYTAPSEFVVLAENKQQIISREGKHSYSSQTVANYYYAYSYKTGELVPLPFEGHDYDVHSFKDNVLVHAAYDNEQITLSRFHLSTGEAETEYARITAGELGVAEIGTSLRMANDRLYLLLRNNGNPVAAIIDVNNGDLLYTGEAAYDGPDSEASERMDRLHLLNLLVIP